MYRSLDRMDASKIAPSGMMRIDSYNAEGVMSR